MLVDPELPASRATADGHAIVTTRVSDHGSYGVVSVDSNESLSADSREIAVVESEGRWLDIGWPWESLRANELLGPDRMGESRDPRISREIGTAT